MAIELLEGIRACVVTLNTLQSLGLKMKKSDDDIMEREMIYFHLINQTLYEKMKFSIKDFFRKYDQIRRKLRI